MSVLDPPPRQKHRCGDGRKEDVHNQELLRMFTPPGSGTVLCGVCLVRGYVTVHEIVPRSMMPGEWDTIDNQVPICNECHETITARGAETAGETKVIRDFNARLIRSWRGEK